MKKVALVFVVAVLLPSLVLAWLAVRSLRDQQFLLERQESLLCQRVTDSLAGKISDYLAQQQQSFGSQVENILAGRDARDVAARFDSELRRRWPLAEVGFCVTVSGQILSPSPNGRTESRTFYRDNGAFLGNREVAEVYNNANALIVAGNTANQPSTLSDDVSVHGGEQKEFAVPMEAAAQPAPAARAPQPAAEPPTTRNNALEAKPVYAAVQAAKRKDDTDRLSAPPASSPAPASTLNYKAAQVRKVSPQSSYFQRQSSERNKSESVTVDTAGDEQQIFLSKAVPAEAEFSQLIGGGTDGMLARFLQNKLRLMFWHRLSTNPSLIFGAQLDLTRVVNEVGALVRTDADLRDEICIAVLDDNAKPMTLSQKGFSAGNWKHPFVATEIGEALPHWEVAAYLVNPAQLTRAAHTARLTLGLLVAVLVLAIGVGSWLIVRSLNAELKLARQKTDFVGNVSHELKTPLTSIRMFSELLAENRVANPAKQRSYLDIITAEAARLTRLINNVLDFSRMERGEKKYNFAACDLVDVVRNAAQTFRPHLEANGFKFTCTLPEAPISLRGDADALSQIVVNLLSNAEKYSNGSKEITLELVRRESPLPHVEVRVLDRGSGVPRGSEEKIFEKFYRAHDSLNSGVQGSGLGLTIARQIARAHGGDVVYEPRPGGGSCFILRLPLKPVETTNEHQ
jgi:signal transduction histidine kinase